MVLQTKFLIFLGLSVVSLLLVSTNNYPLANFYIPLTRAWELFLGSIACLLLKARH